MRDELDPRCKGCLSYEVVNDSPISSCAVLYEKNGHYCPCCYCLVKMVCSNPCRDFDQWDIYLNGEDGRYQGSRNGQ